MKRAFTLASTLITIALLGLLAVAVLKGPAMFGGKLSKRADGKGETIVGLGRYAAKDEVCRNNLSQVRASIQILETSDDTQHPASIEETNLGKSYYRCPIGKEGYAYDPQTGIVRCPHPGHERY